MWAIKYNCDGKRPVNLDLVLRPMCKSLHAACVSTKFSTAELGLSTAELGFSTAELVLLALCGP